MERATWTQQGHKKALEIYDKAKAVLVWQYGVLLSRMAVSRKVESVAEADAHLKEAVERSRTINGTDLLSTQVRWGTSPLCSTWSLLDKAIPRDGGGACRVYSDQHQRTVDAASCPIKTRSIWATSFACAASAATSRRT